MKKVAVLTLLVMSLLIADLSQAQGTAPVGEQFQVNSYTTGGQSGVAVAADALGNFVVVWGSHGSPGTDTSDTSIQGQRYDASGTPLGGQFQVNSYTTDSQWWPALASDAQGNFVVVWYSGGSYGTDTDDNSIQGQRYDATGAPAGGQFQVNSYTTDLQRWPAVASDAQGNFVVAWTSYGSYGTDTDDYSIQAQRYDASGTPVGGQFQVNSYTTNYQVVPAVASDAEGNFLVVWDSLGSCCTDTGRSLGGQRYNTRGAPVGGEFQVNTYTTGEQNSSAVSADAQGNFVVVWNSYGSYGSDTDLSSIQGQRYDATGAPAGGEFQVNSYTADRQHGAAVAADPHGSFVIAWTSYGSYGTDTDDYSIQAQRYDASGTPVGAQFQVNSYTTDGQGSAAVAADAQGNFAVAWTSHGSYGTDTDGYSIQAQRYSTGAIFTDGFESGDTSSWSSAVE